VSNHFHEWHWEITRLCNLLCRHCITDCGHSGGRSLTTKQAKQAIGDMIQLGAQRLLITGGEPLMRQDLFELLNHAHAFGIDNIGLLTNGWLIDGSKARKLTNCLQSIGVSLDGASAATHDKIRGLGSFNKACQAIALLSASLPVSVYITVSAVNYYELDKIIKLARQLGASFVHVSEINLAGRASLSLDLFALSHNQQAILRQFASSMTQKSKPDIRCTVDFSSVYLSAEGLVYACSEVGVTKPDLYLADITEQKSWQQLETLAQPTTVCSPTFCCYQTYTGIDISFCLNTNLPCPMLSENVKKE